MWYKMPVNSNAKPKAATPKKKGIRKVNIRNSIQLPVNIETTTGSTSYQNLDLDHIGELVALSQHKIVAYQVFNSSDNPLYVKFWDTATTPVLGVSIPVKTIMVPAGGGANMSYLNGANFALGLWWSATQNPAADDATDPVSGTLIANVDYLVI